MESVSFEEESYHVPHSSVKSRSGFATMAMRMGLAKDEKEANALLLWVALVGCVLATGLFIGMYVSEPKGLNDTDIERIIKLQQP